MKTALCIVLIASLAALHAAADDKDFLIRQAGVSVDVDDIDAIAGNIPDDLRLGVMDDPNRIAGYLETIVLHRAVAADARRHGLDQDPIIQREIQIMAEGILAKHHVKRAIAELPEPDYEQLAKERYLASPDQYMAPAQLDLSHILISTRTRSEAEALAIATEAHQKLTKNPESLEDLVAEYSDDPSAENNNGRFDGITRGRMAPPFEQAAFALSEPGDISEPVKTKFGYHVIVLHDREPASLKPFDKVKGEIIAELRQKHDEQMRTDFLDKFRVQPMEVNEEAVLALRERYAERDD